MDVAKCIKLYANMESGENWLKQPVIPNDIPLFAVPTTAGTGSEATRFAVIYDHGVKQSVAHESCIPSAVLFDPDTLKSLPLYQKKATMLDAFSHAAESYWSVHSTAESRGYADAAIRQIMAAKEGYLAGTDAGNAAMLQAANTAGKAINITQTTAGHAMCYKLTGLYGISHGHAAALCNAVLFPYMLQNPDACTDPRGRAQLESALQGIADAMGCDTPAQAAEQFRSLLHELEITAPALRSEEDIRILCGTVNPERLRNHPAALNAETIEQLYRKILQQE
jgi:alcohol dehydrogenase class IV